MSRITIDYDVLDQQAHRLLRTADDIRWPWGLQIDPGVDPGMFGWEFQQLGGALALIERIAVAAISDAADLLERASDDVLAVRGDFQDVEEAASAAFRALQHDVRPSLHTPSVTLHPTDIRADGLIAARPHRSSWKTGLYVVEDIDQVSAAITSGSWIDGGIAGASALIDTVATVSDPIGSLIGMGLSWMLEHLNPLADWYLLLTGNPDRAAQHAQTWTNVADVLASASADLQARIADLDDMDGDTIEAYRPFLETTAERLDAVARGCAALASALTVLAELMATAHDMVRDALSQILADVGVWLGEEISTLGIATPLVAEQLTTRVTSMGGRAIRACAKLVRSSTELAHLTDRLGESLADLSVLFRMALRDDPPAPHAASSGPAAPLPPLVAKKSPIIRGGLKYSPYPPPKGVTAPPAGSNALLQSPPPLSERGLSITPGSGKGLEFADETKAVDHFEDHGDQFGARTTEEYAQMADDFVSGVRAPDTIVFPRLHADHPGDVVFFNPRTLEFAITGLADGRRFIRTYYVPDVTQTPGKTKWASIWEYVSAQQ